MLVRASALEMGYGKYCSVPCRVQGVTIKHGHGRDDVHSRTYRSWASMKQRCTNPKSHKYENYGGRGITYCASWEGFEKFLEDMGERPEGMTLDRIDPNGNYEPSNCRWLTVKAQQRNKIDSVTVTYLGEPVNLTDLAERLGVMRCTLEYRWKSGWPEQRWGEPPSRSRPRLAS
jgi:hypothetical protein